MKNSDNQFINFAWQVPKTVPTLIQGKDAKKLYDAVQEENLDLGFLDYDETTKTIRGSNSLRNGQINRLVASSGLRTAVPTDNIYETIFPLIKDRFYSDLNALDVRGKKPNCERNYGLWKKIIELAESREEVKFPFRIQGFNVEKDESEQGYKIKIVPASNFRIIHDDKLNLSSGTKFSGLNKDGMVIPDKDGSYNWYSRNDGLSRVCLDRNGDLDSWSGGLAYSSDNGRVVLLTTEGGARNFLDLF